MGTPDWHLITVHLVWFGKLSKRNTVRIVLVVNRIVTGPLVWGHQGQGVCADGAQIGEVMDSGITLVLLGTNAKLFHRLSPSSHRW